MSRCVVWFSCGAASAVAAKVSLESRPDAEIVYCDVFASESEDNPRFMRDVERWIGKPVTVIRSADYKSVDDVFERTGYMSGIQGARCTVEMKKVPRFAYQQPDAECYRRLQEAGIELPLLYRQGYNNNNCIGCVKATSPAYWNKVRSDYPDVFARRARQSRELGVRLTRLHGERVFLDDLPTGDYGRPVENVSCGPECAVWLPFQREDTHA